MSTHDYLFLLAAVLLGAATALIVCQRRFGWLIASLCFVTSAVDFFIVEDPFFFSIMVLMAIATFFCYFFFGMETERYGNPPG